MNRDDIIRMAWEAGLGDTGVQCGFIFFQPGADGLERFAALVAAAEREACAAICRKEAAETDKHLSMVIEALEDCAFMIERRGEK